jgi:hypothetical protein
MEKFLTEEINRTLEIMGISTRINIEENKKNIVSESSVLKGLMRQATDFFNPQIKKLSSGAKEYFLGNKTVEKEFYEAFQRLANDFDTHWPTFLNRPTYLKQLASILRGSSEITKQFYTDLITDLVLKARSVKSEMNFYNTLKKREVIEGAAFDLEKELEQIIPNEFEREILFPTIRNNYESFKTGNFKPTVFPKNIDTPTIKLTPKQIKNFNKVITTSTRYWNNFTQAFTKSLDDFRLEVEGLSKGFLEELPKLTNSVEEAKALSNAYAVQISNKLSLMEAKMKGSAIELMAEEGIPKEVLDILRTDQEQFFKLFRDGIKEAEEKGFNVGKFFEFMSESISNNLKELATFFKTLFSKDFKIAVKHLFDPKKDLGIWFYTNQWAGLNKLFHLAVKTGAFQNKKAALEWLWKALIATNVGYLVGWGTKAGLLSAWELIGKPLYNMSVGNLINFGCEFINNVKPGHDCSKYYIQQKDFGEGIGGTVESALTQEFLTEGVNVMNNQYSKDPVYSSVMRLLPVINYIETWRHSMFAKGVEGLTQRQLIQNYIRDPNPQDTTNTIINNIDTVSPGSTDSIQINWDR